MLDLLNYLEKEGYQGIQTIDDEDTGEISHIYFENAVVYFMAIYPHSGNQYRYLLRAQAKSNFDRWSVAAHQSYHANIDGIIHMLEDGLTDIYEDVIEDLSYDYNRTYDEFLYFEDKYLELREGQLYEHSKENQ